MNNSEKKPWYKILDEGIMHTEHTIMATCMIAMSLIVFVNVVLRYSVNVSFTWAEEVARMFAVWVCFVGASACMRFGAHVRVDIVPMRLSGKTKKIYEVVVQILVVGISLLLAQMAISRFGLAVTSGNVSATTGIKVYWVYLAPLLGFIFSAYESIKVLILNILDVFKKEEKTEGIEE